MYWGIMEREKTVFISYRRTNIPWALAIFQNLTQHGLTCFLITTVLPVVTSSASFLGTSLREHTFLFCSPLRRWNGATNRTIGCGARLKRRWIASATLSR